MKKISFIICLVLGMMLTVACQDKDIDMEAQKVSAPDAESITGQLRGDDYVWQWNAPANGLKMQVTRYQGGTLNSQTVVDGTEYVHEQMDTNVEFTYVFKLTDGTNFSKGVVKTYLREGAQKISGLAMSQVDKQGGYDAKVEWNKAADAESIQLTATNGKREIFETLPGDATSYVIPDVVTEEEWNVTVVASNAKGMSLSSKVALKIGKTAIGFLSEYATPEELVEKGDDDEASAWLWLHDNYASAQFVSFSDIKSVDDLEPFRVLFWLRDLENVDEVAVWTMPANVEAATPIVAEWYKNGGNLLLWSHATAYIAKLGRLDENMLRSNDRTIGTGAGGWNPDVWRMAVQLHPGSRFKKDFSNHPIYKGMDVTENDRTKLIAFKGPGWTEDHNCLFFNIPSVLTGIGNQEEACYSELTSKYGIYPLGTWDSQIDWVSQLNVWEAQQGNTEFKGTVLCIGNGGCEFSLKNADGTPDKSAYPKNNPYQDNVLRLAKNSLEYLKTR